MYGFKMKCRHCVLTITAFMFLLELSGLLGSVAAWHHDGKRSREEDCIPPCEMFKNWCKNNGKCRQKMTSKCHWYCECPANCEGYFCERIITNDGASQSDNVEVVPVEKVGEYKSRGIAFDKSKLRAALANIYMKRKRPPKRIEEKTEAPVLTGKVDNIHTTTESTEICPPGKVKELMNKIKGQSSDDKSVVDSAVRSSTTIKTATSTVSMSPTEPSVSSQPMTSETSVATTPESIVSTGSIPASGEKMSPTTALHSTSETTSINNTPSLESNQSKSAFIPTLSTTFSAVTTTTPTEGTDSTTEKTTSTRAVKPSTSAESSTTVVTDTSSTLSTTTTTVMTTTQSTTLPTHSTTLTKASSGLEKRNEKAGKPKEETGSNQPNEKLDVDAGKVNKGDGASSLPKISTSTLLLSTLTIKDSSRAAPVAPGTTQPTLPSTVSSSTTVMAGQVTTSKPADGSSPSAVKESHSTGSTTQIASSADSVTQSPLSNSIDNGNISTSQTSTMSVSSSSSSTTASMTTTQSTATTFTTESMTSSTTVREPTTLPNTTTLSSPASSTSTLVTASFSSSSKTQSTETSPSTTVSTTKLTSTSGTTTISTTPEKTKTRTKGTKKEQGGKENIVPSKP